MTQSAANRAARIFFVLFCLMLYFFLSGQFLLSSTLEPDNSLAQISSEWIQLNDMSCLSLWYQMDSRSVKRLL